MRRALILFLSFPALTSMALAHADTKDPTVKAWMHNMKEISADTKTIGAMAKNQTAFNAEAANAALDRIADRAVKVPALFSEKADDPTSEARDAIWTDWATFEAEAALLMEAAQTAQIDAPEDLRPALAAIGATCKSCHGTFRD